VGLHVYIASCIGNAFFHENRKIKKYKKIIKEKNFACLAKKGLD
jgi:hypothetical protein